MSGRWRNNVGLLILLLGLAILYLALLRSTIAGFWYDDGIYLQGAKALAQGIGYRLLSEPGTPAIVKYPPLLSLVLAPIWWLNPHFPQNLLWLKGLNVLFGLTALALLARLARSYYGWAGWSALLLTLALGLHPTWLTLVTDVMSEPLYLLLTLALMILTGCMQQRGDLPSRGEWVGCILLSVAAFYTRTIGIAAVAGVFVWLWQRWDLKLASRYLLMSGGLCAIWWAWTVQQPPAIQSLDGVYLTSYNLTYFNELMLEILKAQGLSHLLWENAALFPAAVIQTLLPGLSGVPELTAWSSWLALPMVGGLLFCLIRIFRRDTSPVEAYVVFYLLVCLLWSHDHYSRLLLPVFPLLWLEGLKKLAALPGLKSRLTQFTEYPRFAQLLKVSLAMAVLICLMPQLLTQIPRGNTLAQHEPEALWQDYQATFQAISQFSRPQDVFWSRYSAVYPLYTNRLVISRNLTPNSQVFRADRTGPATLQTLFSAVMNREKVAYLILEPLIMGGQMVQLVDPATAAIVRSLSEHFKLVYTSPKGYIAIFQYTP